MFWLGILAPEVSVASMIIWDKAAYFYSRQPGLSASRQFSGLTTLTPLCFSSLASGLNRFLDLCSSSTVIYVLFLDSLVLWLGLAILLGFSLSSKLVWGSSVTQTSTHSIPASVSQGLEGCTGIQGLQQVLIYLSEFLSRVLKENCCISQTGSAIAPRLSALLCRFKATPHT